MDYIVKPNFRVVGKMLGNKMKDFQEAVSKLDINDVNMIKLGHYKLDFQGEEMDITEDMIVTTVKSKPGYCASTNGNVSVILDTTLTKELLGEGLAREFVRKVQSLRKEKDLVITDHIIIYYSAEEEVKEMLKDYEEYIKNETLGEQLVEDKDLVQDVVLNDYTVGISIIRVNNKDGE